MSEKLSIVPMKGKASAAMRGMYGTLLGERFHGKKWPASQSVQPGDDPPVLRSVDRFDPPGIIISPGTAP